MKRLNFILLLSSLSVILVTVERFSFTTKVFLQPYSFLRLHELVQMTTLIAFTTILPFLILREITNNFESVRSKKSVILCLIFVLGVYFYGTGNGIHEVSGSNFSNFCNIKNFSGNLCRGFFFNSYYTGNILFFLGATLMITPLLLLERLRPNKNFGRKDLPLILLNAMIYSLAIFSYAAFDIVSVGLIYSLFLMVFADILLFSVRKKFLHYPVTTYTAATYTLGTIAALIIRFR